MNILNATEDRSKLYGPIDEVGETHEPFITGKRRNAVLTSEEDWNTITETMYLLSVSGLRESIKESLNEKLSDCSKEFGW
ncbi:MAG: type II toxin-antitoxin system Phd/YefM family antitoxin [Proteobacteria bacterium]|nr:type II toxin-antitoxin system Phd/YefM family antitoxin [Pseudomonadota bacterium]